MNEIIPVVKLTDFFSNDPKVKARFVCTAGEALRDIGFFALEDHGIDTTLIRKSYKLSEDFFMLNDAQKNQYDQNNAGQRGFTSFGKEHAKDNDAPDLKEFWHVGREFKIESENTENIPSNVWPEEIPEFKNTFLELYQKIDECSLTLLKACALFLEEDEDLFSNAATNGNSILRLIHYPPVSQDSDPKSIRAAAHEDINLITLLCESTASGLELLRRDGSWGPVEVEPGQIIVDSGDMLQQWTNGYFRSTTHRVVNPDNSRERRFSMPYFVHPRSDVNLAALKSCVQKTGGVKKFEDISSGDFLQKRLAEIGLS